MCQVWCFYPACHEPTRVLVGNVIGHGIQMSEKTRTTTRKQWQQLHVLTFLGGRESVCKIICAIGDYLDTSGRLEDLPGGLLILVFGELTDNDILKKVRSLESWHGQLCNRRSKRVPAWRRSQTRKDQGHSSARARCWHSVNWPILTLLLNYPARQE